MKLRAALGFFTRLPIGSAPLPPTFRGVIVWLPAVGLIVGAVVAAAVKIAGLFLPAALCGVIGCLTWVAVTGGLHLDGVADCWRWEPPRWSVSSCSRRPANASAA